MNDITAGDTKAYTFQRRLKTGEVVTEVADSVTFTLYCPLNCSAIVTKTLGNGVVFNPDTSMYTITLNADDTKRLAGRYNFSIRVTTNIYEQTIKRGHIDINPQCSKGGYCG